MQPGKTKKLSQLDHNQTYINDYAPLIKKASTVIKSVKELQNAPTMLSNKEKFSTTVFERLLSNAHRNCRYLPHGRRYDETIKKFSLSTSEYGIFSL